MDSALQWAVPQSPENEQRAKRIDEIHKKGQNASEEETKEMLTLLREFKKQLAQRERIPRPNQVRGFWSIVVRDLLRQ
jgi:hypothetical protein